VAREPDGGISLDWIRSRDRLLLDRLRQLVASDGLDVQILVWVTLNVD
jgi:hypothetical protein